MVILQLHLTILYIVKEMNDISTIIEYLHIKGVCSEIEHDFYSLKDKSNKIELFIMWRGKQIPTSYLIDKIDISLYIRNIKINKILKNE
jgi:hypothetical protein